MCQPLARSGITCKIVYSVASFSVELWRSGWKNWVSIYDKPQVAAPPFGLFPLKSRIDPCGSVVFKNHMGWGDIFYLGRCSPLIHLLYMQVYKIITSILYTSCGTAT